MTIPNHIALGLIIGKVTGDYTLAISTSLLLDCDHFVSLYKHGALKSFKLFWKTTTDAKDLWGDQRGILHNLFSVMLVFFAVYFSFGISIATTIGLSHLGHISLDAISKADSWLFRPFSNLKTRGFIPYYSTYEIIFFVGLILIFFLL